jgi:hypothetical protein
MYFGEDWIYQAGRNDRIHSHFCKSSDNGAGLLVARKRITNDDDLLSLDIGTDNEADSEGTEIMRQPVRHAWT